MKEGLRELLQDISHTIRIPEIRAFGALMCAQFAVNFGLDASEHVGTYEGGFYVGAAIGAVYAGGLLVASLANTNSSEHQSSEHLDNTTEVEYN